MLKIGLIGCGYMGTMHANCYRHIAGAKLAAVADIQRNRAETLAAPAGAEIYGDGAELLSRADVDAVDICLPTYLHAKYALSAMEKVKYVFIEKPVALTAEECDLLLEKSRETGCRVQVGQVIRFWDEYAALKKMADSGIYGKTMNANFRRISPRPGWGWENWLCDASRSGGAAQDLHVHDVDFILSLYGRPKKFYSVKNKTGEKNSYINTIMEYEDKAVSAEGTWDLPACHPFEASFRVVFEKAVAEYAGGKLAVYDENGVSYPEMPKKEVSGENFEGGNISDLGGYYNELAYFCERAAKQEEIDRATLKDAAESLKFVLSEIGF